MARFANCSRFIADSSNRLLLEVDEDAVAADVSDVEGNGADAAALLFLSFSCRKRRARNSRADVEEASTTFGDDGDDLSLVARSKLLDRGGRLVRLELLLLPAAVPLPELPSFNFDGRCVLRLSPPPRDVGDDSKFSVLPP